MSRSKLATLLGILALASLPLFLPWSPAPARAGVAPGCWEGQVGLYNQFNWEGVCYGFAGNNDHYDESPDIREPFSLRDERLAHARELVATDYGETRGGDAGT